MSAGPRQSESAPAIVSAAPRASPARSAPRAAASSSSNWIASIAAPSSAYPSAASRIESSPSARRNRATWCCTAFRGDAGRSLPHSASTNVSVETTRPDRSARHHERLTLGARHLHWLSRYDRLERPQEPTSSLSNPCPPLYRSLARQAGTMRVELCGGSGPVRPEPCPELPPGRSARPLHRPAAGRASPPARAPPRARRDAPGARSGAGSPRRAPHRRSA